MLIWQKDHKKSKKHSSQSLFGFGKKIKGESIEPRNSNTDINYNDIQVLRDFIPKRKEKHKTNHFPIVSTSK